MTMNLSVRRLVSIWCAAGFLCRWIVADVRFGEGDLAWRGREKDADYKGHHALRAELRRLRSITLIEMRDNRHVRDMRDGSTFDLADYVKLTPLGERWAKRIKEIEQVTLPEEDYM